MTFARSAALRLPKVASRLAAACALLGQQTGHIVVVDDERLAAAAQARAQPAPARPAPTNTLVSTQSRPRSGSIATSSTIAGPRAVAELDLAVQQLGQHQRLGRALLEPAHVDQARADDLAPVDVGDPGHRQEDPAPPRNLDHEADRLGARSPVPEHDDDVAHPADLVA